MAKRSRLIASSFGRQHNPAGTITSKATLNVQFNLTDVRANMWPVRHEGEEREKYWQMAVSYYKGYDLYKIRAAHRQIPVMVLEPAK